MTRSEGGVHLAQGPSIMWKVVLTKRGLSAGLGMYTDTVQN